MKGWLFRGFFASVFASGLVAGGFGGASVAIAAEYLEVGLGLFSLSVNVDSLEVFAETGNAPDDLDSYVNRLSPQTREQLRTVLSREFEVSPVSMSQLTYTDLGEDFLTRLGRVVKTSTGQNGAQAIRAALILAAADPEGLSVLSILAAFPSVGIEIDGRILLTLQDEVNAYFNYRDAILVAIADQSEREILETFDPDDGQALPDLRQRGDVSFSKTTLVLQNQFAGIPQATFREFPVDLYLPVNMFRRRAQLVVISHGLGSNRAEFAAMAEHLASYGFAVAVPEHPGSNTQYQQELLANLTYEGIDPLEFIYRPWDVKTILNVLSEDPVYSQRINTQTVGIIGHSFGGYTALALAGAPLNAARLKTTCGAREYLLNLSTLLQCNAARLPLRDYELADDRISAVMAYSPVSSVLLGPESLEQIQIPVMIVAGSSDFIAPAIPEQIHPFVWLETPVKYLAILVPASHISFNGDVQFAEQVEATPQVLTLLTGPDPSLSSEYAHALNAGFMGFYLSDRPDYEQFLGAAYAEYISEPPIELRIASELTAAQLINSYGGEPPIPIYPPLIPAMD